MYFLSKIYHVIIGTADKFVPQRMRPIWEHPAGPKTIFFWAPLFKWGLVFAGLSDLARPPGLLSINQTFVLMTTGAIWTRYSLIIIPKNWNLFSVNLFVFLSQAVQFGRSVNYKLNKKAIEKMALKN